jgi:hypothetical protein
MKLSRLTAAAAATPLTALLAACGTADPAAPHDASLPGDGHSHATLHGDAERRRQLARAA